MRLIDLINNKKHGLEHTKEEINYIIDSMVSGLAPDYQISAWLMAVYFNGLTEQETVHLTDAIIQSGDTVNLNDLTEKVVDIHTTGGVGDKATIALIPILVAAGVPIIKLLGRGLGNTGGTIDKLESIPGFNTGLAIPDMINQLRTYKFAVSTQIQHTAPANRTLQALKHATSTTDALPLIASSVVSKKVATGADNIIIDVKYGSGTSAKTAEDAVKLSRLIVNTGKALNKSITTIVTSMDEPLGRAIGNSIEVIEAIEFLKGKIQTSDLAELVYEIGAVTLMQLKRYDSREKAIEYLKYIVTSGAALETFKKIIRKQKGNVKVIDSYDKFELPMHKIKCDSKETGFVNRIDAYKIAYACRLLGAVRDRISDDIDKSVGVFLNKKNGDHVEIGETLFTLYVNNLDNLEKIKEYCYQAFSISTTCEQRKNLVYEIIRNN